MPTTIFSLKKALGCLVILFMAVLLISCSDLDYYLQCASGHMDVMASTRPIEQVIVDPQTPSELRDKLEEFLQMRDFSVTELGLPDNDSYRNYADIRRTYVVWNVVATKEFSLEPKLWCFPVAGCVSYKGYFDQADAEEYAASLQAKSYDVDLYGVQTYSTLSWFDDPVLNTFVTSSDATLAGLLFHELAHQLVYIADDSSFNEAFAMTVQIEGVRRWFVQTAEAEEWQQFLKHRAQSQLFQNYLQATHEQLSDLYRRNLPEEQMRQQKQQLLTTAIERFTELKDSAQLDNRFDRWMERGLNNARLAGIATYRELVPGFQAMLNQCQGDLDLFYEEVRALSKLPKADRLARLKSKSQPSVATKSSP